MSLRFGTDGVRGIANVELTPELVLALGRAAARTLGGRCFAIGRDTRVSGPLLQAALTAGMAAEGADVIDVGVVPTPAVAWLAAAEGIPAAVISASHNPFPDNGVKFFAAGGRKLSDEVESRLEAELDRVLADGGSACAGDAVGRVRADPEAAGRYEESVAATIEGRRLDGLRVVVDCANGAAHRVGPSLLRRLGAEVTAICDAPDGTNINDGCGSTQPERLCAEVLRRRADVGLAFDGDADRVMAVDHFGRVVDGDQLLAMCAVDLRERGRLRGDTVVVTVMTNLGFHRAMSAHGIRVVATGVGDRYVLEALEENGWSLGGEQSGHIIFRDLATTGDGLLTGVQVLDLLCRSGRSLADLAGVMERLPQVLRNVRVADRDGIEGATSLWEEVRAVEALLGSDGRVLVRPSGTEPVVRVMVEAPTQEAATAAAERLCAAITRALGSG